MSRFIKYLTIIIVIFLIIITILNFQYIGILFIDEIYGKYPTLNKLSAFGDSFGSINTFISSFALIGVIWSVIMQKKELQLQREELRKTTEELHSQKEEFEQQNKTARYQRFDNTFFQLLNNQREKIQDLHISFTNLHEVFVSEDEKYDGRNVFKNILFHRLPNNRLSTNLISLVNAKQAWEGYYSYYYASISTLYFKGLLHLLEYISSSSIIDESDKEFYANIVRTSLSKNELITLFLHAQIYDVDRFKHVIYRFSFFQDIKSYNILDENLYPLYDEQAYTSTVTSTQYK
jgi:hypothetical protein